MSYFKNKIDHILLIILALMLIVTPAVAAYYAGIYHAVSDSHVYMEDHEMVVIELDGHSYIHFVEGLE